MNWAPCTERPDAKGVASNDPLSDGHIFVVRFVLEDEPPVSFTRELVLDYGLERVSFTHRVRLGRYWKPQPRT